MWETKQLMVAIDFHSIFFHTMQVNGYQQLFANIFQTLFFVFNKRKQVIQVWNQLK